MTFQNMTFQKNKKNNDCFISPNRKKKPILKKGLKSSIIFKVDRQMSKKGKKSSGMICFCVYQSSA